MIFIIKIINAMKKLFLLIPILALVMVLSSCAIHQETERAYSVDRTCSACNGKRYVVQEYRDLFNNIVYRAVPCPNCKGNGFVITTYSFSDNGVIFYNPPRPRPRVIHHRPIYRPNKPHMKPNRVTPPRTHRNNRGGRFKR